MQLLIFGKIEIMISITKNSLNEIQSYLTIMNYDFN